MAAPAYSIDHGTGDLITRLTVRRRADGFDEVRFEAHTDSENSYAVGTSLSGYGSLKVSEVDHEVDGAEFLHTGTAIGLRDGSSRLIASEAEDAEEGFDTGSETWASLSTEFFTYGRAHSEHTNLRCVSIKKRRAPVVGFSYFDLSFKGIKSANRPDKFSFQTMTKETLRKNFIVTLLGGDTVTPHDWNLLLATPVLQRQYVSFGRPNATAVGNQGSGGGVNFPVTFTINATDADLIYQWPNGVVLIGLSWEEVPGTNICFATEIYVKRDAIALG